MAVNAAGNYTKPGMRKRLFERIKAGWQKVASRASGLLERRRCLHCNIRNVVGAILPNGTFCFTKIASSMDTSEVRTKSGKPSTQGSEATGERYLPAAAIKAMSSAQYAASSKKKREDIAKGKQFSKQPKSARQIAKRYR